MKFVLGKEYCIKWLDHFATENKTPEEATKHNDVVITSYGKCIGINPKYIILAYNYENDTSGNNDNIHIMKKTILGVRKI